MRFNFGNQGTGWLEAVLYEIPQPWQASASTVWRIGQLTRRGLAVLLSALMIMIPMGQSQAFAQSAPGAAPMPAPDGGQPGAQAQPLAADQLDQLVAPIALYPDPLVAQVLAAATYPTQVVEADRWRQAQGNAAPEQIAAGADTKNWDPSVKALTAFPTVLAQMDRNLQWTTDLGNAYYNQPQDVMDSVQAMRQKAEAAGQLRTTQQQTVTNQPDGPIMIAPANPQVVYVPYYNPWAVYGPGLVMYPGFYYGPPAGVFWGGLAIGFGVGIGIGLFAHWGWGWGHWGLGWGGGFHGVVFNHNTFVSRGSTVINRGFGRPGGPPRGFAGARGAYGRPGGFNRSAAGFNRAGAVNRAGVNRSTMANRSGFSGARPGGNFSRPGGNAARPGGNAARPGGAVNRGAGASRPSSAAAHGPSGGSHPSGGHASGGHPSGGGHAGGHESHGK
jgi:hypothetical protein